MEDIHLVEAALVKDKIIFSRDEECRRILARASMQIGDLRDLVWINPDSDAEEWMNWLGRGAPCKSPYGKTRTLKQFAVELQKSAESPS